MTRTTQLLVAENDRLALEWAGPFGYAVLQVLRRSDDYSEADFQALLEQGRQQAGVPDAPRARSLIDVLDPEAPPGSTATAGVQLEPSPPPEFYRRVTKSARPGLYPQPAGQRDTSGRYVRPVR